MTPKEEIEQLMNDPVVIGFAQKMLSDYGEFHPFGAAIKTDHTVGAYGADDGQELGPGQPKIDLLMEAFKKEAEEGKIRACVIVANVLTVPPGETTKVDAIEMFFDHKDNYSVSMFFPYTLEGKNVTLGQPFGSKGTHYAFDLK